MDRSDLPWQRFKAHRRYRPWSGSAQTVFSNRARLTSLGPVHTPAELRPLTKKPSALSFFCVTVPLHLKPQSRYNADFNAMEPSDACVEKAKAIHAIRQIWRGVEVDVAAIATSTTLTTCASNHRATAASASSGKDDVPSLPGNPVVMEAPAAECDRVIRPG